MEEWFEKLIVEKIWKALGDAYDSLASWAEPEIEAALDTIEEGKVLSPSPLVKVLEVDNPPNSITLLIRGRIPLFKAAESVFMRIEIVISKDISLTGGTPIKILEWKTVMGDLKISVDKVFEGSLAFGYYKDAYDMGVFLGRLAVKIIPARFGLDLFLGGLNERGAMFGLDIDLPNAIPLGPTGLGLCGFGGDFALNFVPRLESRGVPETNPTAEHYVAWARNTEIDRWKPGPIDQTAVGIGICTDLCTIFDSGYILKLEDLGFAVLTPGPIFMLGGTGVLLSYKNAKVGGIFAVDIPSASLALGLAANIKIPDLWNLELFKVLGKVDAFFSFQDPGSWYINLGQEGKGLKAESFISAGLKTEMYFMIDSSRFLFGAEIAVGGSWSWWKIKLLALMGAKVRALVGWNPVELEGGLAIFGQLGIEIWWFKFTLIGQAEAIGHTPSPTQLDFKLRFKLDLPWPLDDIEAEKNVSYSDTPLKPPPIKSPFQLGESNVV